MNVLTHLEHATINRVCGLIPASNTRTFSPSSEGGAWLPPRTYQHRLAVGFNIMGARTHGMSRTPEYRCWMDMHTRCSNSKHKHYKHYGGRGITICLEWNDFSSFLRDVGMRPGKGFSIDRQNNNGNYEPLNCKWIPLVKQSANSRRAIALDGAATLGEASRNTGIHLSTIRHRRRRGLPLLAPVGLARKLNASDVVEIRMRYKATHGSANAVKTIAASFGVKSCTISNIAARRIWRHLP